MPEQQPNLAPQPAPSRLAPMGTTQFVTPPPAPSGKPGCGYTIFIVIVTIFLTITAEIIIGFFLVGYIGRTVWKNVQKEIAPITGTKSGNATTPSGGTVKLTPDQKKLIESFGINPNDIPTDVPVQTITCVQDAIGSDRIQQIMKGTATPGIMDLFRARGCLTN